MDVKIAEEEFDRWLVAFKVVPDTIEKLKEVEKEI